MDEIWIAIFIIAILLILDTVVSFRNLYFTIQNKKRIDKNTKKIFKNKTNIKK